MAGALGFLKPRCALTLRSPLPLGAPPPARAGDARGGGCGEERESWRRRLQPTPLRCSRSHFFASARRYRITETSQAWRLLPRLDFLAALMLSACTQFRGQILATELHSLSYESCLGRGSQAESFDNIPPQPTLTRVKVKVLRYQVCPLFAPQPNRGILTLMPWCFPAFCCF